jgi:tripartite-type tricarboxylate transporter receptor subunit TctC
MLPEIGKDFPTTRGVGVYLAIDRVRRSDRLTSQSNGGGNQMRGLRSLLLLASMMGATGAAADYPDRPIRLVVPQAPGSATDTVARILGAELAKEVGQQVVVDNRPGGALTIGLDLTAKAEPDGYTLCLGPIGALAITRHMVAKLPYDIERDFQPVALVDGASPSV